MEDQVLTRGFQSGRSLGMIRGTVELAAKLAAALQLVSPMLAATLAAWTEADAGLGSGADHTAIIRWLEALQPPAEPAKELEPLGGATRT
jgi:3-hydroxyisobutyrate dehydrogenase